MVRRSIELNIGNLRWKTAIFYEIRCLGGPESLKSAMENSCFYEIRCLGGPESSTDRLFWMENSCFYEIRCLGRPESPKSSILDWKRLLISNQVFSGIFQFFRLKSWFNPFAKNPKWWLKEDTFLARKCLFYIKNRTKHYLKIYFGEKWREKFSNFGTKIMG